MGCTDVCLHMSATSGTPQGITLVGQAVVVWLLRVGLVFGDPRATAPAPPVPAKHYSPVPAPQITLACIRHLDHCVCVSNRVIRRLTQIGLVVTNASLPLHCLPQPKPPFSSHTTRSAFQQTRACWPSTRRCTRLVVTNTADHTLPRAECAWPCRGNMHWLCRSTRFLTLPFEACTCTEQVHCTLAVQPRPCWRCIQYAVCGQGILALP